jgi:hypothetical protein
MTKLQVDCETNADVTRCKIIGTLDEDFAPSLFSIPGRTVIFDFNLLSSMNSCGIRDWIKFIDTLKNKRVVYERCPRILVDQMNMIKGFLPKGSSIRSVYAPFFSATEEEEIDVLISMDGFNEEVLKKQRHPKTGAEIEFDDIPSQFFAFLKVIE